MQNKINKIDVFAAIFRTVALGIAFLFALNGRYIKVDDDQYFDKWRCVIVWLNDKDYCSTD